MAGAVVIACVAVTAWTMGGSAPTPRTDPRTGSALMGIAQRFNDDYSANRDGSVYDRWDSRSRRVISRRRYVELHALCPTAPAPAVVESAAPAGDGSWRVRYDIGGVQLIDYWHYVAGRWRFSLTRSNPGAVKLYRLSTAGYMAAVGCSEPIG